MCIACNQRNAGHAVNGAIRGRERGKVMREERTVRRIVGAVVGTRRGREASRGGRWVPGLVVVGGREVRADQCLHDWRPTAERGAEACGSCPATCHRGDDGKIESYSAGLAAPERADRVRQ
jgi:hypothetical protein